MPFHLTSHCIMGEGENSTPCAPLSAGEQSPYELEMLSGGRHATILVKPYSPQESPNPVNQLWGGGQYTIVHSMKPEVFVEPRGH